MIRNCNKTVFKKHHKNVISKEDKLVPLVRALSSLSSSSSSAELVSQLEGDGISSASASASASHHGHELKSKNFRSQRPIYIAATKQHVGKTTVSLALMSGLTKRFNKVGFIKPVG